MRSRRTGPNGPATRPSRAWLHLLSGEPTPSPQRKMCQDTPLGFGLSQREASHNGRSYVQALCMETALPKTITQLKKRLEEAMNEAHEAEEIIPPLKEVIAKFELVPDDLFETGTFESRVSSRKPVRATPVSDSGIAMYRDTHGNTWAGKGRRPNWLIEALELGKTLEDFLPQEKLLSSAK